MYSQGESYSAINTARSALSAILCNEYGLTIGKFPAIKRFLKGVFELRPPKPKYSYIWDVNIVLSYLRNFHPDKDIYSFILLNLAEDLADNVG